MLDTLKTAAVGSGSFVMQFIGMIPDIVKAGVGIATIVYLAVKIKKEIASK